MRTTVLCCLLCSVAIGQWLEKTVYLPDSLSCLRQPLCLTLDPARRLVYVSGNDGDGLVVLDAQTGAKVGWIPMHVDDVRAMCLAPEEFRGQVQCQAVR